MINVRIDKDLATYMSSKKIRLDELFAIVCFNLDQLDLLRSSLISKSQDQLTAYFQSFERKMLLKKVMPELADFDWDNYEVTDASKKIFEDCSIFLMDSDFSPIIEEKEKEDEDAAAATFNSFVEQFVELFPEGIRNKGGEYLRSNRKDVFKKMVAFMKKYPYNGDTILNATKRYLKQQAVDGYGWCSSAHFFISKDGISKLATECEAYLSKGARDAEDTSWTHTLM